MATRPLFELPVEQLSERYERLFHGGGGEVTQVTYDIAGVDAVQARRLTGKLRVGAWDEDATTWLHNTLRMLARGTHHAPRRRDGPHAPG